MLGRIKFLPRQRTARVLRREFPTPRCARPKDGPGGRVHLGVAEPMCCSLSPPSRPGSLATDAYPSALTPPAAVACGGREERKADKTSKVKPQL